jgi:hypothetical protein
MSIVSKTAPESVSGQENIQNSTPKVAEMCQRIRASLRFFRLLASEASVWSPLPEGIGYHESMGGVSAGDRRWASRSMCT